MSISRSLFHGICTVEFYERVLASDSCFRSWIGKWGNNFNFVRAQISWFSFFGICELLPWKFFTLPTTRYFVIRFSTWTWLSIGNSCLTRTTYFFNDWALKCQLPNHFWWSSSALGPALWPFLSCSLNMSLLYSLLRIGEFLWLHLVEIDLDLHSFPTPSFNPHAVV